MAGMGAAGALPGRKAGSADQGGAGLEPKNRAESSDYNALERSQGCRHPKRSPPGKGNYPRPGGNPLDLALRAAQLRACPSGRRPGRQDEPRNRYQGVDQGAEANPGTTTRAAAPPAVRTLDLPSNLDRPTAGTQGSATPPAEKTEVKPR